MQVYRKFLFLVFISILLNTNPLLGFAKKKSFIPLPGYWHIDQLILLPNFGAGTDPYKCTLLFNLLINNSSLSDELIDSIQDISNGNLNKKPYAFLLCDKNKFFTADSADIKAEYIGFNTYKPNSSNKISLTFENDFASTKINLEIDPDSNKRLVGKLEAASGNGNFTSQDISASRKDFLPNARVTLINSISALNKGKITAKDTITFMATVKSLGPTTLADEEAELYIQLNDEISASDISILTSVSGSENISTCSGIIDSNIPAQIQCRLKGLGPNQNTSKLVFRVTIPESLEKKKLKITSISGVVDEDLKFKSRPATFTMPVKAASPAKVSCLIKGSTPFSKITGFVNPEADQNSALLSSFELIDSNKSYVLSINGGNGSSSDVFSLSGDFSNLADFSSLLLGETNEFKSNKTRLSATRSKIGAGFTAIVNKLELGGNEGTGPFDGLLMITGSSSNDQGKTTASGLVKIKMTGASFSRQIGTKTKTKNAGDTTVTCKFRDIIAE